MLLEEALEHGLHLRKYLLQMPLRVNDRWDLSSKSISFGNVPICTEPIAPASNKKSNLSHYWNYQNQQLLATFLQTARNSIYAKEQHSKLPESFHQEEIYSTLLWLLTGGTITLKWIIHKAWMLMAAWWIVSSNKGRIFKSSTASKWNFPEIFQEKIRMRCHFVLYFGQGNAQNGY